MPVLISDRFDAGNIKVLNAARSDKILLEIREDLRADFMQWFFFQVSDCRLEKMSLYLTNAGKSSYPEGWVDYKAFGSYDLKDWFRVPTRFDGANLILDYTSLHDSIFFAYFPPYSYQRHMELLAPIQMQDQVQLEEIGESADRRSMSLLTIGKESPSHRKIWIIARQHPGESMAEWFIEGFLQELTKNKDLTNRLLKKMVLYVVPNMNPDGSILGNLRTNARGANLNREWMNPTMEKSPEVLWVRNRIHSTGVDFFLDVHGDEGLPYCFAAGCEGVPRYNHLLATEERRFRELFMEISPDFQKEFGYEPDAEGQADLRIAANYICETFGCPALTLEMPFKQNKGNPIHGKNWNHKGAKALGASLLRVLENLF